MDGIVAGVAVGIIVAVVGAITNYIATLKREEKQREHELRVQQDRWDREDHIRYHEERLTAYRNLYNAVEYEKLGFEPEDENHLLWALDTQTLEKGVEEIIECFSEVAFICASDEVRDTAEKAHREALVLKRKAARYAETLSPLDLNTVGPLLDPVLNAGAEFREAARKELGIKRSGLPNR